MKPYPSLSTLVLLIALSSPFASVSAAQSTPVDADLKKFGEFLELLRDRNARDYKIATPNGIDEAKYVPIGGIEQWITIRGEDRSNPVVLFLHGGPGDATNPWGYAGFRPWLGTFTVVQWDQRGSGRTLGRNGPSSIPTIGLDRRTRDGIELAEHLRKALGKERIVLVGHSFGSILGLSMARARPDLFWAYVGTGQVADPKRSLAVAYDELRNKAQSLGDERALRELEAVGPPPYPDGRGWAVQHRWSNLFEGADLFIHAMFGLALDAPGATVRDVNDWLEGQMASADRLVPETSALEAKALAGDYELPVFVI